MPRPPKPVSQVARWRGHFHLESVCHPGPEAAQRGSLGDSAGIYLPCRPSTEPGDEQAVCVLGGESADTGCLRLAQLHGLRQATSPLWASALITCKTATQDGDLRT